MKDLLIVMTLLAAWIVLNRWVLPWCGIQTCLGGACSRASTIQTTSKINEDLHPHKDSKPSHTGD